MNIEKKGEIWGPSKSGDGSGIGEIIGGLVVMFIVLWVLVAVFG